MIAKQVIRISHSASFCLYLLLSFDLAQHGRDGVVRVTLRDHLLFNHLSKESLSEGIIVLLALKCN